MEYRSLYTVGSFDHPGNLGVNSTTAGTSTKRGSMNVVLVVLVAAT
jgi:hypothetical protein